MVADCNYRFLGSARRHSLIIATRILQPQWNLTYCFYSYTSWPLVLHAMSTPPTESSHKNLAEDHDPSAESRAKRRKIRRGTRSCWECKRRKIKCMFSSPADSVCISCQRHCTKCVSQEFSEEVSAPLDRARQMGDRILRVEALVEQLITKAGNAKTAAGGNSIIEYGGNPDLGLSARAPIDLESPQLSSHKSSKVRIRAKICHILIYSVNLLNYFRAVVRSKSRFMMAISDFMRLNPLQMRLGSQGNMRNCHEFYMNHYPYQKILR